MDDQDRRDPLREFVEAVVYAPLGAGARFVDDAPAAMQRIRNDLAAARMLGEMAVTQGVARVRQQLEADPVGSAPATRTDPSPEPQPEPEPEVDAPELDDLATDTAPGDESAAPTLEDLAIPDYDVLPAIDIVGQLAALSVDERAAVARYEEAHRGRRTVLGKIEQLGDDG